MHGYAQTQIVGRLTRDPEGVNTRSGGVFAAMSVAVNRPLKNADGTWDDDGEVHFFDLVQFGKAGQRTLDKLKKGDVVTVYGTLAQRRWTADDGTSRSKVQVKVNRIWSAGFNRDVDESWADTGDPVHAGDFRDIDFSSDADEDDIPF